MKKYVTNSHAALMYIVALLIVGYTAAYPYLNPNNLQLENALFYSAMAIVGALVYGHGHVSTQARIVDALPVTPVAKRNNNGGPPTRRVPAIPLEDSPDQFMPPPR